MPDFGELEQEAKDHSQQVDEGIQKADQMADRESAGRDQGLIDKAAAEAEKQVGDPAQPAGPGAGGAPGQ